MNIPEYKIELLRALKGPALSVYLALGFSDDLMGPNDLVSATNWSKNLVGDALNQLMSLGLAQRVKHFHGWGLTGQGRSILLEGKVQPANPSTVEMKPAYPLPVDMQTHKYLPTTPTDPFLPFKVVVSKYSSTNPPTVEMMSASPPTVDSHVGAKQRIMEPSGALHSASPVSKTSTPSRHPSGSGRTGEGGSADPISEDPEVEANLRAMAEHGLKPNARTLVIARREDITPELIHAHHQRLLHRRHYEPGLLVTTLEANDVLFHETAPRPNEIDDSEDHMRYIKGKYGHIGEW